MVALLVDQRETFNLVLLRTRLLLLTACLNQLSLRLQRQSQSPIRGPLIQHTHQPQFPFLSHLRVAEDLLLVSVDKVEMLRLAVSVAMAM
jgi:hypothetical protein